MGVVYLCLHHTNIQTTKNVYKKPSIYGLVHRPFVPWESIMGFCCEVKHGSPKKPWTLDLKSSWPSDPNPSYRIGNPGFSFHWNGKTIWTKPSFSSSILILGGVFLPALAARESGSVGTVVSFQDSDGSVVSRRSLVNFQMAEVVKYQPPHTTANSSIEDLLVSNAMGYPMEISRYP